MATDFGEGVGFAGGASLELDDGHAFHDVRDGNQVAGYGDVDRCGCGSVAGNLMERVVFEIVDYNLRDDLGP